ncbi:MAG: hypothetical protein ABIQ04_01545 [Candidatus Saccharimonadales bacterium]
MKTATTINRPVDVTAIGFGRDLRVYPRCMEYGGISYRFLDAGLRTVIRSGEHIAQILTMSDGISDFRLRSDNRGGSWTLLSMTQ